MAGLCWVSPGWGMLSPDCGDLKNAQALGHLGWSQQPLGTEQLCSQDIGDTALDEQHLENVGLVPCTGTEALF